MANGQICLKCRTGIVVAGSSLCAKCLINHSKGGAGRKKKRQIKLATGVEKRHGQCPICSKTLVAKADGHLRPHKNDKTGKHCAGSGGPPIKMLEALKNKGAASTSVDAVSGGLPGLGKRN